MMAVFGILGQNPHWGFRLQLLPQIGSACVEISEGFMSVVEHARRWALTGGFVALTFVASSQAAEVLKGRFTTQLDSPSGGVAGVSVSGDGGEDKISDTYGRFQMTFPNREPGHRVKLDFKYKDWDLVNVYALPHTLLRNQSGFVLELWIAPRSEVTAKLQHHFQSRTNKAIELESNRKTEAVRKKLGAGEISPSDANIQFEQIKNERARQTAVGNQMAKDLSRLPVSEQDPLTRQAMREVAEGRPYKALETMEKRSSGAIAPGSVAGQTLVFHSQLLHFKGLDAEAETKLRQAAVKAPSLPTINQSAAEFYLQTGRPALAKEVFQQALIDAQKQNSTFAQAAILARLGAVSSQEKKFDEGRVYFSQSLGLLEPYSKTAGIDSKRDLAVVYDQLGQLELKSNRKGAAAAAWGKSLSVYKDLESQKLLLDPVPAAGLKFRFDKVTKP